jgi:hypothetical protein
MKDMVRAPRRVESALADDDHGLGDADRRREMVSESSVSSLAEAKDEDVSGRLRSALGPEAVGHGHLDHGRGWPKERTQNAADALSTFEVPGPLGVPPLLEAPARERERDHRVPGVQGHDDRAHGLGVSGWRDRTRPRAADARDGAQEKRETTDEDPSRRPPA